MIRIFYEPFYPSLMAAIVVVVAIIASVAEIKFSRELRGIVSSFTVYAVPTIILGFCALVIVFNMRQAPDEYFACRNIACRELYISPVREAFRERLILVELALITLMVVMFLIRNTKSVASASANLRAPDPKIWHFDANSGEYFRITGHHKGHVIFDTTPYSRRVMKDFKDSNERSNTFKTAWISGIILGISIIYMSFIYYGYADSGNGFRAIICGIVICFSAIAFFVSSFVLPFILIGSLKDTIGPAPQPARGLEDVEEQKAYGNAGPADIDAIHNALGGNLPSTPSIAGPRRPLFDE